MAEKKDKEKAAKPSIGLDQQIAVNAQYIKDLSFENPRSPKSLIVTKTPPKIDIGFNLNVDRFEKDNMYEVAFSITAKASHEGQPLFVVELVYAGLFTMKNLKETEIEPALLVYCPNILFPYARRIVSDTVRDGGFPPLMLEPIDFAKLYIERQNNKGQKAS